MCNAPYHQDLLILVENENNYKGIHQTTKLPGGYVGISS